MTGVESRPRVGVGCLVHRDGLWLLMRRRSAHGSGQWSTPGGCLDHGETIEACAAREVREETDLVVQDVVFLAVTNDVFDSGAHFVTIWTAGESRPGDAKPDEREVAELGWFAPNALPTPLFLSFDNLLRGRSLGAPSPESALYRKLAFGFRQ